MCGDAARRKNKHVWFDDEKSCAVAKRMGNLFGCVVLCSLLAFPDKLPPLPSLYILHFLRKLYLITNIINF